MKSLSSKASDRFSAFFMLLPIFLIITGFYFYPALYNFELSLTDMSCTQLRSGGNWIGLENYFEFFTSQDLFDVAFNTVVWLTAVSVFVRIFIGLLFALLLHSKMLAFIRLSTLSRLFLLIPWATPPVVSVIAWRWMIDPTGGPINQLLLNFGFISEPISFTSELHTVWPTIVTIIVWNTTPLIAISLLAALQTIPNDLIEAAILDGADCWQQFRFIVFPFLLPTISVLSLMSVIWTFNNFIYVWLTTEAGPGTYTNVLATEIYMKAFIDMRLGYSSAIGVTMAIILLVLGAIFFKTVGLTKMESMVN